MTRRADRLFSDRAQGILRGERLTTAALLAGGLRFLNGQFIAIFAICRYPVIACRGGTV